MEPRSAQKSKNTVHCQVRMKMPPLLSTNWTTNRRKILDKPKSTLGGLAEFERSLIKARTNVGIKRARARHPLRPAAKSSRSTSRLKRCACLMKASRRRRWRGCSSIRARSRGWRRAGTRSLRRRMDARRSGCNYGWRNSFSRAAICFLRSPKNCL